MLADRWKFAVWLGKSDPMDEHLVRTDEGVVYARFVRRLAEHSWSEVNLRAVVETQKPKSTTLDILPAAEPVAPPLAAPEIPEDKKEEHTSEPEEDEEMQESQRTLKRHQECRTQAEARSTQKHKRICL